MGGRAFLEILQGATFPRMESQTYYTLKARHLEQLRQLYRLVGVPREAPEKTSHGDLDYVVCAPRVANSTLVEDIKNVLGAVSCIKDGLIFNFAIPLEGADRSTFYQVDVNQCLDEDEWERVIFFRSYGDLGMIIGLLARANGLSLGLHGLKIPHVPEYNIPPFMLSTVFPRIFEFFGLDLAVWKAGFPSLESTFEWAATSRLFNPHFIKESPRRAHRREDREMYQRFLVWVSNRRRVDSDKTRVQLRSDDVVAEAKVFFSKRKEYDSLVQAERRRREAKDKFNGNLVMEWTGLHGKSVKVLMDAVREDLDEEMIHRMTHEEIKAMVLRALNK
ncbi:hypothetical protein K439DRAFT_1637603 [Ramaria rubella]|nr:hypothetical protein K439DRAFT_1637603 [Ramaria rubella]